MDPEHILKEKDLITDQIKKYVPGFSDYFNLDMTLLEFSKKQYDFEPHPVHIERQKLVKEKIYEKLQKLFGKNFTSELHLNLDGKLAFNIADHHQVLNHPILISSNVISSTAKFFQPVKQDAILVISSGDVPPNNYFSKSGFQLHEKRVPIFSASEKEYTAYYIEKRKFDFIERLKKSDGWKKFNDKEQNFLTDFEKFIHGFDYSRCNDYCDQVSVILKNTWPLLFEEKIRETLPELIYLTQEEITTECLIPILEEEGNFIYDCMFDKEFREKTFEKFRGIVVTWNEKENKGTHFFWMKYPGRPQSIRLYFDGEYLVPQHDKYKHLKIPLNKKAIIAMLKKREIYPSLFTIFSVLNFYAGIRPLTGYGSSIYLHLFRSAWVNTLKETKYEDEIGRVENVGTSGLIAGLALFFKKSGDNVHVQYAHDIFCDGPITEKYLQKILNTKFADLLSLGVIDMYDYFSQKYIPPQEKINKTVGLKDLVQIMFKDVL